MKYIPLTRCKQVIVDDENYEWLSRWKWYLHKGKRTYYAIRNDRIDGKQIKVYMHRLILNAENNDLTDHINHNGLDNRLYNMRLCTPKQNCMNRRPTGDTSKYKGVYYNSQKQKWVAQICYKKKRVSTYIGSYTNEIEAAKAYDTIALEMFGEYANCNFI